MCWTAPGYDLTTLRLGDLMIGFHLPDGRGPDVNYSGQMPWGGSVPDVEQRIADLAAKRATARAALEDAVLDDDERVARDAEARPAGCAERPANP